MSRNTLTAVSPTGWSLPSAARALGRAMEPTLRRRLDGFTGACLVVEQGSRRTVYGDPDSLSAVLRIHDPAAWARVALRGALGAGESYSRGEWSSPDLTTLVQVMLRNRDVLQALDSGLARLSAPLRSALHAVRRNTRQGSRENITSHLRPEQRVL